jgi:hypothetical protein
MIYEACGDVDQVIHLSDRYGVILLDASTKTVNDDLSFSPRIKDNLIEVVIRSTTMTHLSMISVPVVSVSIPAGVAGQG